MTDSKVLVCFDFDYTLIDGNSDIIIKSLYDDSDFPEYSEKFSKNGLSWIDYMREIFNFLYKNNITKEDYITCLSELQIIDGMKELLLQMNSGGDCEIIMLSDSNSFFIQCILSHHRMSGVFDQIFTNPADFDKEGCLQIKEYGYQVDCKRCPHNMCKGAILEHYVDKRLSEGVQFRRIFYVGDGSNDVCPALRLEDDDYVFAKAGSRLLRSLEKMPAKLVKAVVIPWKDGHDIRFFLLSS